MEWLLLLALDAPTAQPGWGAMGFGPQVAVTAPVESFVAPAACQCGCKCPGCTCNRPSNPLVHTPLPKPKPAAAPAPAPVKAPVTTTWTYSAPEPNWIYQNYSTGSSGGCSSGNCQPKASTRGFRR